jgi:hypothetical protein
MSKATKQAVYRDRLRGRLQRERDLALRAERLASAARAASIEGHLPYSIAQATGEAAILDALADWLTGQQHLPFEADGNIPAL